MEYISSLIPIEMHGMSIWTLVLGMCVITFGACIFTIVTKYIQTQHNELKCDVEQHDLDIKSLKESQVLITGVDKKLDNMRDDLRSMGDKMSGDIRELNTIMIKHLIDGHKE